MTDIPHFIITRIGIGIYDPAWFQRKLPLFRAITLSSIMGQTNLSFHWLIAIDRDIPGIARIELGEAVAGRPNIHIVPIALTELKDMRHGGFEWVFRACREYILANGLIDDPTTYVVTSVIDDDDAWHRDTIDLVGTEMDRILPTAIGSEKSRHWLLRHTGGATITYPNGLRWYLHGNYLVPDEHAYHSMSVFVMARFSSGVSACSSRHGGWPNFRRVMGFEERIIPTDTPMWLYVRHRDTLEPWDEAESMQHESSQVRVDLAADYGVDLVGVERWRRISAAAYTDGTRRSRNVIAPEQYDRQHRLTALNEQIRALQCALTTETAGRARLEALLSAARDKRAALLEEFRAATSQGF